MNRTEQKSKKNGILNHSKQTGVKSQSGVAKDFSEFFVDELKDIYWAEKELTKAIPKMIKNATSEDLAEALKAHLDVTKQQIIRLEKVFASIGEKAVAVKCEAMAGLTKEAAEIMEQTKKGVVRDAGIILAGQKVEHYEIATYGTLCAFAKALGEVEASALLEQTLMEEKEADERLSQIAQAINLEAADEDESEDDTEMIVATKSKRK